MKVPTFFGLPVFLMLLNDIRGNALKMLRAFSEPF